MPRQGSLQRHDNSAYIELHLDNAVDCLDHLEGFSHIWVTYVFHKNSNWKPKVTPPTLKQQKVGVFASRSPHRPNPIGLSLLPIEKISKNKIYVKSYDLINESPILDIKPYVQYADEAKNVKQGWLEDDSFEKSKTYTLHYSEKAKKQIQWLNENSNLCFEDFLETQLSLWPMNTKTKRITNNQNEDWTIAYRTWRVGYAIDEKYFSIVIKNIYTGYTNNCLMNSSVDEYNDKNIHLNFQNLFD